MNYQTLINTLFAQFTETLSVGITTDIYTVMSVMITLFCILIGIRLLSTALREEQEDNLYNRYNSKYNDKKLTSSEGRSENKRQRKSMESWLSANSPESAGDSLRKRNY